MESIDYTIVGIYIGGVLSFLFAFTLYLYYRKPSLSSSISSSSTTPTIGTGNRSISSSSPPPTNTDNEAKEFYLAKESSSWWIVAASYYASNIGTDAMIGLASASSTVGIVCAWYDIWSPIAFLFLAYIFLPIYRKNNIYTLPEYTFYRYGPYVRTYLSLVSLILYATNKIASALLCGILILSYTTHISFNISLYGLLFITAIFSTLGGLRAVMYIEVLNTILLFVGGTLSVLYTLSYLGFDSYGQFVQVLRTTPSLFDVYRAGLDESFTHLSTGTGPYALPGLMMGSGWLIGWFHLTDQEMVQRGLSASTDAQAKLGTIIGGILKLTVPWMWCVPGLLARYALFEELGCAKTTDTSIPTRSITTTTMICTKPNYAYPALITHILPSGLRGIMVAGAIAGVISVLSSTFNSAATMVSMDLWKPWITHYYPHRPVPSSDSPSSTGVNDDDIDASNENTNNILRTNPDASNISPLSNHSSSTTYIRTQVSQVGFRSSSLSFSAVPLEPPTSAWRTIIRTRINSYFNRSAMLSYLASPHILVWIGRIFIFILTGISIAWLPLIAKLSSSIYIAMQSLNAYVAPPILSLFVLGIFVPSVHEYGGLIGLGIGHLLGFIRLILLLIFEPVDTSSSSPPLPMEPRNHALVLPFSLFIDAGFLQFAAFEGIVSMILMVITSAAIKRPPRGYTITDNGYEHRPPLENLISPIVLWLPRTGRRIYDRFRNYWYGTPDTTTVTTTNNEGDTVDGSEVVVHRTNTPVSPHHTKRSLSPHVTTENDISVSSSITESDLSLLTNDPLPTLTNNTASSSILSISNNASSLIRLRVHSSFETLNEELLHSPPRIRTRITTLDADNTYTPPLYTTMSTPIYRNHNLSGTITDIYIHRKVSLVHSHEGNTSTNNNNDDGNGYNSSVIINPKEISWYRTDDFLDTIADICAILLLLGVSVSIWILW